jgi:hypothetical protein
MKLNKDILIILLITITCSIFAQNHYLIEYDKLNDKFTYYQSEWVNGKNQKKQLKEIKLEQNDVVNVNVTNVNPFVYETKIINEEVRMQSGDSPIRAILQGFSGFIGGGPALALFKGLASNSPSQILQTRGGESEKSIQLKKKISQQVNEMHELMKIIAEYKARIEKDLEVMYSKTKTKEEILENLKLKKASSKVEDFTASYSRLNELEFNLNELAHDSTLDAEDEILTQIEDVLDKKNKLNSVCLDEQGALITNEISFAINQVEKTDFIEKHSFLGKAVDDNGYGYRNSSNDLAIIFKEIKTNLKEYPVELVKYISLPVKQPYAPYFSVGVDFVGVSGGFDEYTVTQVENYFGSYTDSLIVTRTSKNAPQLAIGTKLCFDLPSKNALQSSIVVGFSISGFNQKDNNRNINLMFGTGVSFKKFPFIALNAGINFCQVRQLKKDYPENFQFKDPEPNEYNRTYLYEKVFKPGVFIGLNFKL